MVSTRKQKKANTLEEKISQFLPNKELTKNNCDAWIKFFNKDLYNQIEEEGSGVIAAELDTILDDNELDVDDNVINMESVSESEYVDFDENIDEADPILQNDKNQLVLAIRNVGSEREKQYEKLGMFDLLKKSCGYNFTEKVQDWMGNNTNNSNITASSYRSEVQVQTSKVHKQIGLDKCDPETSYNDDDDSLHSVDTAKYILSNKNKKSIQQSCKIVTKTTIKHFCIMQQSNRHSSKKMAQSNSIENNDDNSLSNADDLIHETPKKKSKYISKQAKRIERFLNEKESKNGNSKMINRTNDGNALKKNIRQKYLSKTKRISRKRENLTKIVETDDESDSEAQYSRKKYKRKNRSKPVDIINKENTVSPTNTSYHSIVEAKSVSDVPNSNFVSPESNSNDSFCTVPTSEDDMTKIMHPCPLESESLTATQNENDANVINIEPINSEPSTEPCQKITECLETETISTPIHQNIDIPTGELSSSESSTGHISRSSDRNSTSFKYPSNTYPVERHIFPPEILIYQPTSEFTEQRYRKINGKIRISHRKLLRAIGPDYLNFLSEGKKCAIDIDPTSQLVFQPYYCQDKPIPEKDSFGFKTDPFAGELDEKALGAYKIKEIL